MILMGADSVVAEANDQFMLLSIRAVQFREGVVQGTSGDISKLIKHYDGLEDGDMVISVKRVH
jgi:hypothetical protein